MSEGWSGNGISEKTPVWIPGNYSRYSISLKLKSEYPDAKFVSPTDRIISWEEYIYCNAAKDVGKCCQAAVSVIYEVKKYFSYFDLVLLLLTWTLNKTKWNFDFIHKNVSFFGQRRSDQFKRSQINLRYYRKPRRCRTTGLTKMDFLERETTALWSRSFQAKLQAARRSMLEKMVLDPDGAFCCPKSNLAPNQIRQGARCGRVFSL